MEEFLNIDWHPRLEDMIDEVFINEKRMMEESATYRIMQGLFTDPFTEFETDNSEEEEENINNNKDASTEKNPLIQKTRNYVPGIMKPPFKFPRVSNLSKEQHATCLRVLSRFSAREQPAMDPKTRSELELYMKLSPTIREEQEEFLNLAKANWNGSSLKIIGNEYINECWKSKVEAIKKLPRYYYAGRNIPFNGVERITLTPEETLLEMGQLPRVIIPGTKHRHTLYCNMNKLDWLYPARRDSILYKATVSEDPNCESLVECGEIDLVISSGGLNCLANNFGPNYTNAWILPIVVKETDKGNVIYIDKPLPPTAMTVPQKNAWIYKYVVKSQLLHPNHNTSMSFSDHTKKQEEPDSDMFGDLHADNLLELEAEHERSLSSSTKENSKLFKSKEKLITLEEQTNINDPGDSSDLPEAEFTDKVDSCVIDPQILEELSTKPLDDDESASVKKNSIETEKVSTESVESDPTVLLSNRKTNINNAEDIIDEEMLDDQTLKREMHSDRNSTEAADLLACPPGRSNIAYRIFSLGPSVNTNDDSFKAKVKDYRVLVRNQIDGIEKIDKETLSPVMLVPKLEHQVALGAEAVTAEEALKQWTMLTYRPDTSLARIRISAQSSEIIQVERRTAISINNEIKRLYSLNVEDSFVTLHNVIRDLKPLKPGHYLLRHTPTNGAFATIYQEAADSPGKSVFDLHSVYAQNSFQTIGNAPWPAIDKGVITPSQICFEQIPAMYRPPRTDVDIKSKVTRGRGRGRGRGNSRGRGRGVSRDSGRGGLSNFDGSGSRGGLRGGTRVRTKKAKKKNAGAKMELKQP